MTKAELKQYRVICAEIQDIDRKLDSEMICVKDSVQSASKHPYSVHSVTIEGNIYEGSSPALLSKKQNLLESKRQIESFVKSISDYKIRRAVEIYYINPLDEDLTKPTWEFVADKFKDGSSGDSIKKSVSRYFKKLL